MSDERIVERGGKTQIGRQIVLPLRKAVEIAWKSIRIRLWRSLITTSGIVLAIAFLMSVWTGGSVTAAMQRVPEDDPRYLLVQRALERRAIAREDVSIRVGIVHHEQADAASGSNPAILIRDTLQARQEFTPLLLPRQPASFRQALQSMGEEDRFDSIILVSFPPALAELQTVQALAEFVRNGGTLLVFGLPSWPAEASEQVRAEFESLLPAQAGKETISVSADEIGASRHAAMVDVRWSTHPDAQYVKLQLRDQAESLASAGDATLLCTIPLGEGHVVWYPVARASATDQQLMTWLLEGRLLTNSLRWGAREKFRGGTMAKRNLWLVSLSLLVCIVGITNAMLMSVTERFREIGTMKCLGALDSFVVRLFLIESSFQGAAGSLAGALLGLLLAFVRALFAYRISEFEGGGTHWLALHYFPLLRVLLWLAIAVVVGVILAVVAAIYPAYRAARMEPVEAMRTEA